MERTGIINIAVIITTGEQGFRHIVWVTYSIVIILKHVTGGHSTHIQLSQTPRFRRSHARSIARKGRETKKKLVLVVFAVVVVVPVVVVICGGWGEVRESENESEWRRAREIEREREGKFRKSLKKIRAILSKYGRF